MKKLTIRLDDNLHKRLKVECLRRDVSINQFVKKLIVNSIFDTNNSISAAKDNGDSDRIDIDKDLEYIKATLSYEDFELPNDVLEVLADNLRGKYTDEQARWIILKKHGLV